MADKSETIRITGLTELRKELARLDEGEFTKELKDAHFKVATMVVEKARNGASMPVQRKAAASLKASQTANKAQINFGGPGYPFAMGAEFGSKRFKQFPTHLGRVGYFVYPAVRALSDEVARVYLAAVDKIVARAFPDK